MRVSLLLIPAVSLSASAFPLVPLQKQQHRPSPPSPPFTAAAVALAAANRRSSFAEEEAAARESGEREAGVVGAAFFGGNRQKEELFDAAAEAGAAVAAQQRRVKWDDAGAFRDAASRAVAAAVQGQLNGILYSDEEAPEAPDYFYAENIEWVSPFKKQGGEAASTPFQSLTRSLEFYNRLDVAITSSKSLASTNQVELRWEISVVWPNFWEGRVLVTGTSVLTLNGKEIVKQVDTPDADDLIGSIVSQALPRFWDAYHIGMTPSAECSPRYQVKDGNKKKGLFSSYNVYDLPPRLVYSPSLWDTGDREDAAAATIPNHAFCDFIKTAGPRRQRYVPASPLEVQIKRGGGRSRLVFRVPLSVELQTSAALPLPGDDPEAKAGAEASAEYEWQEARRVATIACDGNPQDESVVELRKKLYEEAVERDGWKPKLDADTGRPAFFFWSNGVKACYTDTGLGMSVYEYRPGWSKSNEVGLELERSETGLERTS